MSPDLQANRPFSVQLLLCAMAMCLFVGCLSTPQPARQSNRPTAIQISTAHRDVMWERAVAVLHRFHFQIARESKLEGVIESEYRAGSNLLEPWNRDSYGYANRLESTLQSIRRKVLVTFQETSPDQTMISVRVIKEIEDVPGLAANYEGGATFSESELLNRDLDQVVGQAGPSRWLPRGTDPILEAELMDRIRHASIQ